MKISVPLLLVWASVCADMGYIDAGAEWDAFKLTFGKSELGKGYFDMPWTVKEAVDGGKWVKIDEDKSLNVDIFSQPEDPRVLLLFDKKGNIAGLRMSFIKEDIKKKAEAGGKTFEFDYDKNPLYEKGNYFGKDLWFTSVLFTAPKILSSGGRSSLNKETDDIIESVWFKPEGKWIEVSKDECKVTKDFVSHDCYNGMGKHYSYKLNSDCKERRPFLAMYDKGKISGLALLGYGSSSKHPGTKFYFDDSVEHNTEKIVKSVPDCADDLIDKYGLTIMHVFFKKDASAITCSDQEWRSVHCQE